MLPSLRHGQSVFVVRTRFSWNKLRRGDVALFLHPGEAGVTSIKRVVGLPDEDVKIAEGRVYIDGELLAEGYAEGERGEADKEWFNGPSEYFMLGDNRAVRGDSRAFGPVSGELIRGRAWFLCWPPFSWRPLGRG
jgi:signal peptidase I